MGTEKKGSVGQVVVQDVRGRIFTQVENGVGDTDGTNFGVAKGGPKVVTRGLTWETTEVRGK